MNLRGKILISYGLVLVLVLFVWGSAIIDLGQLGHASEAIAQDNLQSVLAAENMIDAIERQDSGLLLLMLGYEEDGLAQFRRNEAAFLEWRGRAKDTIALENEALTLQMIDDEYLAYQETVSQLRELRLNKPEAVHSTPSVELADTYHETVLPKFKEVRDTSLELRDMNDQAIIAASERAREVSTRTTWSIIVVGAIAIGLGLTFSLVSSGILARPLQEIIAATGKIAGSNYDVPLNTASKDELGRLVRQIMTMSTFTPQEIQELVTDVLGSKRVKAIEARDYQAHFKLAKQCVANRHLEAAQEHVRQAIAVNPSRPEAFNLLGALYDMRRRHSQAMKNYRVALALDPTYKPAQANLSWASERRGPTGKPNLG